MECLPPTAWLAGPHERKPFIRIEVQLLLLRPFAQLDGISTGAPPSATTTPSTRGVDGEEEIANYEMTQGLPEPPLVSALTGKSANSSGDDDLTPLSLSNGDTKSRNESMALRM